MPVVLPPSSTYNAGHTHLLSHYYEINGDSPDEQDSPTTILSHQFDGTQSLFVIDKHEKGQIFDFAEKWRDMGRQKMCRLKCEFGAGVFVRLDRFEYV